MEGLWRSRRILVTFDLSSSTSSPSKDSEEVGVVASRTVKNWVSRGDDCTILYRPGEKPVEGVCPVEGCSVKVLRYIPWSPSDW